MYFRKQIKTYISPTYFLIAISVSGSILYTTAQQEAQWNLNNFQTQKDYNKANTLLYHN